MTFALELYAGSMRWAAAAARAGLAPVLAIDIRLGKSHDLGRPGLQAAVLGWLRAGWVSGLLGGFPCCSWSLARNRPNGPATLRTAEHVMGLPDRLPHDQAAIELGNAQVQFIARVIRACQAMRTPALFENPWSSWAWKTSLLIAARSLPGVRLVRTDQCLWGAPWRKATGLLAVWCDTLPLERVCRTRGVCSRTGKPHEILSGKDETGVFKTFRAESYPRPLALAMAQCIRRSRLTLEAENLGKVFDPV